MSKSSRFICVCGACRCVNTARGPGNPSSISTVISDVATTGNSGSGVFDAGQKCLLGIMSRKIFVRPGSGDKESEQKDIAKYFVPASTIRAFIPTEYRF